MQSLKERINRFIAGATLVCVAFAFSGCMYYESRQIVPDAELPIQEKNMIILHQNGSSFMLSGARLSENTLSGFVADLPRLSKKTKGYELHLFLDPNFKFELQKQREVEIPIDRVTNAHVYDIELERSIIATSVVTSILTVVGLNVVSMFLLLLTSCPYAFIYDGEEYKFIGELYPGSIQPGLERHDYMMIGKPVYEDGQYKLKLENRLREIQHTNLVELIACDHPHEYEVLFDRHGALHSISDLRQPTTAHINNGNSVIDEISRFDDLPLVPSLEQIGDSPLQAVYLTFERPDSAEKVKLVVTARTSLWLEFAFLRFQELFGDRYKQWQVRQKKAPGTEMLQWKLDQGIVLSVYVKNRGVWEFVDYLNEPGPLRSREGIMEIDLSRLPPGDLELKLESGYLFWEIDAVGVDYTPNGPNKATRISLAEGENQDLEDVGYLLQSDDNRYYTQEHIGEYAELRFIVPPREVDLQRTLFLHSKGYYEILRDFDGKADLTMLESFRKPLAFTNFARDLFVEMNW